MKQVVDPDLRADIVSLAYVKELEVEGGRVRFTIELGTYTSSVRDTIAEQARTVVSALEGVELRSTSPSRCASVRPRPLSRAGRRCPASKTSSRSAPVRAALARPPSRSTWRWRSVKAGARVGILDGDIYGPNVPLMLGLKAELATDGRQIRPAEKFGLQVVSLGVHDRRRSGRHLAWTDGPQRDSTVLSRRRLADLDYLIIDMPPGTGDVALSLSQTVPVAGAVVVTTPQQVSLADSRRAVRMYQKLNIPTLGDRREHELLRVPELPSRERPLRVWWRRSRSRRRMDVPFLGRLPVYQPISLGSDRGIPIVIAEPDSAAARAFGQVAERVGTQVALNAHRSAVANKGKIPLIPVQVGR